MLLEFTNRKFYTPITATSWRFYNLHKVQSFIQHFPMFLQPMVQTSINTTCIFTLKFYKAQRPNLNQKVRYLSALVQLPWVWSQGVGWFFQKATLRPLDWLEISHLRDTSKRRTIESSHLWILVEYSTHVKHSKPCINPQVSCRAAWEASKSCFRSSSTLVKVSSKISWLRLTIDAHRCARRKMQTTQSRGFAPMTHIWKRWVFWGNLQEPAYWNTMIAQVPRISSPWKWKFRFYTMSGSVFYKCFWHEMRLAGLLDKSEKFSILSLAIPRYLWWKETRLKKSFPSREWMIWKLKTPNQWSLGVPRFLSRHPHWFIMHWLRHLKKVGKIISTTWISRSI